MSYFGTRRLGTQKNRMLEQSDKDMVYGKKTLDKLPRL